MTEAIAQSISLTPDDLAKQSALRRTKAIATSALIACVVVFLSARAFQETYPMLAYVAAFAEAAAIGGLADWYAVVALFRRPMGLPVPHTAIIPANKDRIANNLGRFIEVNFLAREPVREKLQEVDFAMMVADWLSDPSRSSALSRFAGKLAPQAFSALEKSDGLRDFIVKHIANQIEKIQIAPLAADMLSTVTADRKHQRLFDELLRVFGKLLNDEKALASIRDKIRDELPSLANYFKADAYLLKKIVSSAGNLIIEIEGDQDHALRHEFDEFVERFIAELRTSPDYAARAEKLKQDFLARPELNELGSNLWQNVRDFVEQDIESENSVLQQQFASMLVQIGRQLAEDKKIRADMNEGFVVALSSFVESQKSGVSTFISEQVRRWDILQLTRIIELNIGRDLQYIRFNGMIIGGIAGLSLHIGQKMLFG